jgi:hypothetical protein
VMMKQAAIWSTNIWYWTEAPQCYEPLANSVENGDERESAVDGRWSFYYRHNYL